MSRQSWCLYTVQAAKGETEETETNGLELKRDQISVTLRDLTAAFATTKIGQREGAEWHWRVRVDDSAYGYCWRDLVDAGDKVEASRLGNVLAVHAKVIDVSEAACSLRRKPAPRLRLKEGARLTARNPLPVEEASTRPGPVTTAATTTARAAPEPAARRSPQPQPVAKPPPRRSPQPQQQPPQQQPQPARKISPPPPPPPVEEPAGDMMDFGTSSSTNDAAFLTPAAAPSQKSTQHMSEDRVAELKKAGKMVWDEIEERNVEVEVVEAADQPRAKIAAIKLTGALNLDGKAAHVQKAMLERREALAAAQAEARAVRARQTAALKEEEEQFDKLKILLEPKLKDWSEEYGKKKNVRALLAGMDKVMWPEANWQQISIGDLLEAKKVKRSYFKAARVVHPDKLVVLTYEQRFIGRRVFDALAQAYAEFEASGAA